MVDVHNQAQRSKNMAAIRGSNTKPEIFIRKLLYSEGYRYRINQKDLSGKPDLVLKKYNTVVFIHGCFWHVHDCHLGSSPKTNSEFWSSKLTKNVERDKRNIALLLEDGWNVIVLWECAIKGKYKLSEPEMRDILQSELQNHTSNFVEISGSCAIS